MNQPKKVNPAIAALIVIVLLAVVATAVIVINNANDGSTSTPAANLNSSRANDSPQPAGDPSQYVNGTYSAVGSYVSPGGRETIDLTVTIVDGVITSTSIAAVTASGVGRDYIQRFANGYESEVVGKSVNEIELSRVAGSSLTSNGFNDALEQIKDDAAA